MNKFGPWFRRQIARFQIIPLLIICIFITAGWFIRLDAVFKLEVIAGHVMLDLDGSWKKELRPPLALNSLYIDDIDITASRQANLLPIAFQPQIDEADVWLQSFNIANDGQEVNLELEADDAALNVFVKNARLKGKYNKLKIQNSAGAKSIESESYEAVNFITTLNRSSPSRMKLGTDQKWFMDKMRIKRMFVQEEDPERPGYFIPTVKSGEVHILNSGKKVALGWGDRLKVDGVIENLRMTIEKDPEGFKIAYMGKAGIIEAGPEGFQADLRPRFLEWVLYTSPFPIGLTAFTVLWSVFCFYKSSHKKKRPA